MKDDYLTTQVRKHIINMRERKMKVDVYLNGKKKDKKDYQDKVIKKLSDLETFDFRHKDKRDIWLEGEYANDVLFIRAGLLQIVLKDTAFFGGGIGEKSFYLRLDLGCTWQDVWDKIKNIDSIEYEVK